MVGYCILCKWRSDYKPRRMFHKFPSDPTDHKVWAKIIDKTDVKPNASLCSLHFKRSCYTRKINGQRYLKRGSVPTQHIKEQPSNLGSPEPSGSYERIRKKVEWNNSNSIFKVKTGQHLLVPGRLRAGIKKGLKSDVKRQFRCEFCKRKFLNKTAVKSHVYHVHQKKPRKKLRNAVKAPIIKESDTKMPKSESQGSNDLKLIKPCFECPVCEKKFSIYFSAYQHIQKTHCVDNMGQKVSPLSLNMVKPVRIEVCICNQTIRSDTAHECSVKVEENSNYHCLGCKQVYGSLSLFQSHLKGLHGDDIESYFFPALSEFNAWKTILENQTRTNYVKLSDTTIYHCSHEPQTASPNTTQQCPSAIIVKQIPNGYHMTYYKTHGGHVCKEYSPPEAHRKNCITSFYNDTEDIDVGDQEDEKDLYLQFKKVMNSIVLDAAKINISTLEVLLGKAFEMTIVLNSYDEDEENDLSNKRMSDEQISRVLDDKTVTCKVEPLQRTKDEESTVVVDEKPLKRKREPLQGITKKVRNNGANDEVKTKIESPVTPARILQSPPSFNDSYKSFVDQTIMKTDLKKDKRKAEIVKTKMGQFKQSSKTEMPKVVTPKTATTKIGTPKTSNKLLMSTEKSKTSQTRMPVISKVWTVKPEVEYEVKERENDCNILILKM